MLKYTRSTTMRSTTEIKWHRHCRQPDGNTSPTAADLTEMKMERWSTNTQVKTNTVSVNFTGILFSSCSIGLVQYSKRESFWNNWSRFYTAVVPLTHRPTKVSKQWRRLRKKHHPIGIALCWSTKNNWIGPFKLITYIEIRDVKSRRQSRPRSQKFGLSSMVWPCLTRLIYRDSKHQQVIVRSNKQTPLKTSTSLRYATPVVKP